MNNKLRKWLSWSTGYFLVGTAVALAFVLIPTTKVSATPPTIITFTNQTGSFGDTINVPLVGAYFTTSTGSATLNIEFDPLLISYVSYTNGTLPVGSDSLLINNPSSGSLLLSWAANPSGPFLNLSSSTTLVTLNFTVTSSANTTTGLAFVGDSNEFTDSAGDPLADIPSFVDGVITLNPPVAPTASTTITFSDVSATSITVSWGDVSGATEYQLWSNESGSFVPETVSATTSLRSPSLADHTYSYFVLAHNSAGYGPTSSVFSTTTLPAAPDAPSAPTFSDIAQNTLTASWNAVSGATFYVLYQNGTSVVTTSATTTPVTGLFSSTTYNYNVAAGNAGGLSAHSATSTTTTLPGAPDAPSAPTFSGVTSSSLVVSWSDVSNALYYRLYENNVLVTTTAVTTSNRTSLVTNTLYTYYVLAGNTGGWSASSTAAATTTLPLPPATPSAPTLSNISTSSLTVTWPDSARAVYYTLYENDVLIETISATTSHRTGLTTSTVYSYYLIAGNSGGESVSSSPTATTTFPSAPNNPSGITALSVGTTSIRIGWTDNSDNETGFVIEQAFIGGFGSVYASTTVGADVTSTNFAVPFLNTAYTFRVKAVNTGGSSGYNTSGIIYTNADNVVSLVSTASTSASISIRWGANLNPSGTHYEIYGTGITSTEVISSGDPVVATFSGLTPNTSYTIYIVSENHDSSTNTPSSVTDYTKSANPTSPILSAVSTSTATLTWGQNGNPDATNYYVTGNNSFTPVTVTAATTTNLTGLTPNTSYTFNVQSINHSGSTNTIVSAEATTTIPVDITLPVPSLVSTSTLTLSWTDSVNGGTPVYQVSGNNSFASVTTTDVTKALTGLTPNTSYTFTVKVQKPDSTYTTGVAASATTTLTNVPGAPTISDVATSSVTAIWSANSNPAGTVYYILDSNGGYVTTTATTTSLTELIRNTSYQFQVRAENLGSAGTYSAYSASSTATTTLDLATGVTVSKSTAAVTEGGATDSYTVVLDGQPTDDVVITISVTGAKATVSPTTLTFTSVNYRDPQTVTVTAVDDSTVEGTHSDTVTHSASSLDLDYEGISIGELAVTITDNDSRSSGGGGSAPQPITDFVVTTASTSASRLITLNLYSARATLVAISENINFSDAYFQVISTTKQFTLSAGNGVKTIYVKARTAEGGESPVKILSVTLSGSTTNVVNTGTTVPTAAKYVFKRNLSVGMTGADVKELQKWFNANGFKVAANGAGSPGKETNFFGAATRAAVIKFQKANGLTPANGSFNTATRKVLNAILAGNEVDTTVPIATKYVFKRNLSVGMTGADVKELQKWFNANGYQVAKTGAGSPGKETTTFGGATKAAVIRFQKANSLTPASGSFNTATRNMLNSL